MGRTKNLLRNSAYAGNSSIFARPWFVVAVVFGCFGILTPKIFMPLFRQLFGLNRLDDAATTNSVGDRSSPYLRARQGPPPPIVGGDAQGGGEYARPGPGFGRPAAPYQPPSAGSSSKSLLNYLLPVYAIGIGIYMVYTLAKVFNKSETAATKEPEEESDYEEMVGSRTRKFRENNRDTFRWDANEAEFKCKANGSEHFARSEESEDELNDYERYRNLDPDYVAYLKEKRRMRTLAKEEKGLASPHAQFPGAKCQEVPLTTNIGLTSITNTNLLMNDTLERMKYSLNKINNQLLTFEKQGVPIDDPDMETLRLQLAQTEMQMARIMTIVNSVSDTIQVEKSRLDENNVEEEEEEVEMDMKKLVETTRGVEKSGEEETMPKVNKKTRAKRNKKKQAKLNKAAEEEKNGLRNRVKTATTTNGGGENAAANKKKPSKKAKHSDDDDDELKAAKKRAEQSTSESNDD